MSTPVVTIFVRHARDCKWAGEEFAKACRCGKHLRWSQNGKQYRRKAGTGSWEQAEQAKRVLEAQLRGEAAPTASLLPSAMTIREAVELFHKDKRAQGLAPGSLSHYKCDLSRLLEFCDSRNVFTVALIDSALLYGYRDTWAALYPSSLTRIMVQKRLRGFLKFCYNSQWLDRIPALSPIKNDSPETMPLTEAEHTALLAAVPKAFPDANSRVLVRGVIQLMRWSGLSVRDASMLRRDQLLYSAQKTYSVITARQKTGTHVQCPIPKAVAEEILQACQCSGPYLFWGQERGGTPASAAHTYSLKISAVFAASGIVTAGHLRSHRLRDTFACDLLSKGVPLESVSKLLGHNSVKTTEQHYARWVQGRQDRLNDLVTGTWKIKNKK